MYVFYFAHVRKWDGIWRTNDTKTHNNNKKRGNRYEDVISLKYYNLHNLRNV